MDKVVLEKKVDSILRCLVRIDQRLPDTLLKFKKDLDAQDIVVLNLTRAVQAAVDIATHLLAMSNQNVPATMAEAFVNLQKMTVISSTVAEKMIKSVGFRNIAVHNYDEVDLLITYTIASQHLIDFKSFIKQVMSYYESVSK